MYLNGPRSGNLLISCNKKLASNQEKKGRKGEGRGERGRGKREEGRQEIREKRTVRIEEKSRNGK